MDLILKVRQPSFTLLYCTRILSDALSVQCSCNQSSTQERNDIEPSRSIHMHTHTTTLNLHFVIQVHLLQHYRYLSGCTVTYSIRNNGPPVSKEEMVDIL